MGRAAVKGMTVRRETKVGLLVGVGFIGLFGLILGGRAGSAAQDHARLPVGESEGHRTLARTIHRTIDPFAQDGMLVIDGPDTTPASDAAVTDEQSLPAPQSLPFEKGEPDEGTDLAESDSDDVGLVVFVPERVTTPMPDLAPGDESARDLEEAVAFKRPGLPTAPAGEASRPVHKVRRGQNLTSIAREHYGTEGERLWRRIWEANKDAVPDPHRLREGQKLVIPKLPVHEQPPVRDTAIAKAPEPAPADAPHGNEVPTVTADELAEMLGNRSDLTERQPEPSATYTVCRGDTFYRIATNLYGDGRFARLLILKNKHLVPDETRLQIGQRIVLLDGVEANPAPGSGVARR